MQRSGEDEDRRSIAQYGTSQLLDAIRLDTPRPTVHARNLFHVSVAMWDAWAVFDRDARPYLQQTRYRRADPEAAQHEAI